MTEDDEQLLSEWEQVVTPRQIAVLRIRLKGLLAHRFVSLLTDTMTICVLSNGADEEAKKNQGSTIEFLSRLVALHLLWLKLDPVLGEELGRHGSHAALAKWMKHFSCLEIDDEDDNLPLRETVILKIQERAYQIAAHCRNFPVSSAPLSEDELLARLPLQFHISGSALFGSHCNGNQSTKCINTTLIQQVTFRQSAQEDVGFVMWPSSVVLANLLMENSEVATFLQGKAVLEIGAGCGLAGLVAAQLQQKCFSSQLSEHSGPRTKVILTDFNHVVLENLRLNVVLNDLDCDVVGLDFYQQTISSRQGWIDMCGRQYGQVDLVLGADIICQPSDAVAAATTVMCALKPGGSAYIVCADAEHRFGVERFSTECENVGLVVKARSVDHSNVGQLLGIEKTAGYVETMTLTVFTLEKKI